MIKKGYTPFDLPRVLLMAATPTDPLLTPDPNRLALFPIKHQQIYDLYLKAVQSFWHSGELQFAEDVKDWQEKLTAAERDFLSTVFAFFATAENSVIENLALRFLREVQLKEAQHFYCSQLFVESIHSETYSRIIDVLLGAFTTDPVAVTLQKAKLFNAVSTVASIRAKAEYAQKWIDDATRGLGERLLAFACVEGLGFISSFCAIFWLKKRGLLPGVCQANDWISRDETLHYVHAIELYKLVVEKPPVARIREIIVDYTTLELAFVDEALKVAVIGMNATDMKEYVKFVADGIFRDLGLPANYHAKNPFGFMQMQSLESKTDFFVKSVTQYHKPLSGGVGSGPPEVTFSTDASVFNEEY